MFNKQFFSCNGGVNKHLLGDKIKHLQKVQLTTRERSFNKTLWKKFQKLRRC